MNRYILIPSKELTDAGKRLEVFMTSIGNINRGICNCQHEIRTDWMDMDNVDELSDEEQEIAEKLPADSVALVKTDYDYNGQWNVLKDEPMLTVTETNNLNEYIRIAILPDMEMTDDVKTLFETIITKFNGIYDAAVRLMKKAGTKTNIEYNRILDVGLMNVVNDVFNKFCKEHRDMAKVKYDIGVVLDADIAPIFRVCSYLSDKGAKVAMAPNKEHLNRFFYPLTKKQITSGLFWHHLEDIPYVNAIIFATLQEGLGGVLDDGVGNIVPTTRGDYSRFFIAEEDVENLLRIARKVHSGTYKFVLHFHPEDHVFRIDEDGNIAVDINMFIHAKEGKSINDDNADGEAEA